MARSREPEGTPVGLFHTWWRGDPLPALPALPDLVIAPAEVPSVLVGWTGLAGTEVEARLRRGHRPWLARVAGEPVGAGWVAGGQAAIGELGLGFAIPPGNRYLWDFVTAASWRGRRIYPRLLQAIAAQEVGAERFWLGHDMSNVASARGIASAGFQEVGTLYALPDGGYRLVPSCPLERAVAAATLFKVGLEGRADDAAASGRRERRVCCDVNRS